MTAKKKTEVVEETVTAADINKHIETPVVETKNFVFLCDNHYHIAIESSEAMLKGKGCDVCGEMATHSVEFPTLITLTLRLLGKAG